MPPAGCAYVGRLRRMSLLPAAVAAAALVAACGGGSHHSASTGANAPVKATPATLVAQSYTASNAVRSGKLALTATVNLDGGKLGTHQLRLDVAGPFDRAADGNVSTSLTATLGGLGSNP